MADDEAPRLAPPPKPTVLQHTIPRPEVPEVSLMFDSDDSLIWNKPNFSSKSAPLLQHQDMKSLQLCDASVKRTPLVNLSSDLNEKENRVSQSPLNQDCVSHESMVHKFRTNNAALRLSHKNPGSHHFGDRTSPVISDEVKNTTNPRKTYNPMLYSPSQKVTGKGSMDLPSQYFRPRSPLVESNKNMVQTRVPVSYAGSTAAVTAESLGLSHTEVDQPLPSLKKAVHFNENSPLSSETCVRPKTVNTSPMYASMPRNQSKMTQDYRYPPAGQDKMHFSDRRNSDQRNTGYANAHLLESANPKDMQTPSVRFGYPVNSYRTDTEDVSTAWQSKNSAAGKQLQQFVRLQETIDPKIYQLIEDQNQHILRLYKTLETFLDKKHSTESVDNVKNKDAARYGCKESSQQTDITDTNGVQCKHTATQTHFPEQRGTRSVGVNTDISWEEILSLRRPPDSENFEGNEDHHEIRVVRRNARHNAPHQNFQRHIWQAESRERTPSRQKDFANFEQKFSGEMKEISLTMREVVMTTIHEDQSSPDPSLHINMEEYKEDSVHEPCSDSQSDCHRHVNSPNSLAVGESASPFNQSCRSFPRHEECITNEASVPSDNPPAGTFYNNVLTNIQQILQSSKTTDDDEAQVAEENNNKAMKMQEDIQDSGDEILDPQMEAVRRQLLQFGISFIDPASLAPKHRPLLDTMYLPGIHNMLSIYQSTIVAPYNNVYKETDALAAKYLTDTQLAAIASVSPAMNKRGQNINSLQGRDPAVPYANQFKPRNNLLQARSYPEEDDVSIATKKFLGKYGLTDNM